MKYSVLIPAYKSLYLSYAIESVLTQSARDFEIIIVDDASPEPIKEIVTSFKDSRIKYYRNERNCGAENVVDNWNRCLDYASGDYVICMGDDDMLASRCLEEYQKLIEKYPGLGVYHGQTEIIDENSNFKNVTSSRIEYESALSLIWHRWNGRGLQFVGDFLYDRRKLINAGGFLKLPYAWGSDDITAVMLAKEHGIANTSKTCFYYRQNSSSISSMGSIRKKMEAILKEQSWYMRFLGDGAGLSADDRKYYLSIMSCMPRYFYKKKLFQLAIDLKSNRPLNFIFWLIHYKKYNITIVMVVVALFLSFKI